MTPHEANDFALSWAAKSTRYRWNATYRQGLAMVGFGLHPHDPRDKPLPASSLFAPPCMSETPAGWAQFQLVLPVISKYDEVAAARAERVDASAAAVTKMVRRQRQRAIFKRAARKEGRLL